MIPPPGPTTGWHRLLALTYLAASAGFVEELIYRGMMRRLFGRGFLKGAIYVIVSSAVFSAVHWKSGIYAMSEALAFGTVAAIMFALTSNIWPLVVAHTLIDLHYLW